MICLNQKFFILADRALNRKISSYKCHALINLNFVTHPANDDNVILFREKENAEVYRMKHDKYIDRYLTIHVDSHDVCKLCECFNLEVDMR